jgi:hypothetical protein
LNEHCPRRSKLDPSTRASRGVQLPRSLTPAPTHALSPAHTIDTFVPLIESGQTVEAMERCHADHAKMQENAAAPRVCKLALIRHERFFYDPAHLQQR